MKPNVIFFRKLLLICCCFICFVPNKAQDSSRITDQRRLYRPKAGRQDAALVADTLNKKTVFARDSVESGRRFVQDSLETRMQFIRDSIEARMIFVRDSILAREIFVRDSLQRRKEILDSVLFLKTELPRLLQAAIKTVSEEIVINSNQIRIVGDSMLTDFVCQSLPLNFSQPYTPWETSINLSDRPVHFVVDTVQNKITYLQIPAVSCSFKYGRQKNILILHEKSSIMNKGAQRLFKSPVDSVFFDRKGQVIKIKRYYKYYQATSSYQRGAFLFLHLAQIRNFTYASGRLTAYQAIKYCDRWRAGDVQKVCNVVSYGIRTQGTTYYLNRRQQPANDFADGDFTYVFDQNHTLKSVSFNNVKNTENRKTIIEVNDEGYVSRYIYQKEGKVNNTLLINYYHHNPAARHKVETISCTFEDDGISYFQKNNTTGRSRSRDKMTLEWTDWLR